MTYNRLMITQEQGVTIVTFLTASIRELDQVESIRADLHALVEEQARRKVVLDFTGVGFLGSWMLRVLIDLQAKARGIGGRVIVCGLRAHLKEMFDIAQMHKVLELATDQRAALASFDVLGQA